MKEETKQFTPPTSEEFASMTPDQQSAVLSGAMEEVHRTYKENPLTTEDLLLKKIKDAIDSKGFNFYPHALCKAIDAEAERQFQEMIKDIIKGVPPTKLNDMKSTIIKWYNEEEERFETYKNNFMNFARGPVMPEMTPTYPQSQEEVDGSEKVTPIEKAKGKKKK